MTSGRYRWRTVLRRNLPGPLGRLFPKGRTDCGDHHWYNHDGVVEQCYHCEAGQRAYDPSHFPEQPAEDVFSTPEAAALSDYPAAAKARVVQVRCSRGHDAAVVEITTEPDYPYFIHVERTPKGWMQTLGHH